MRKREVDYWKPSWGQEKNQAERKKGKEKKKGKKEKDEPMAEKV